MIYSKCKAESKNIQKLSMGVKQFGVWRWEVYYAKLIWVRSAEYNKDCDSNDITVQIDIDGRYKDINCELLRIGKED